MKRDGHFLWIEIGQAIEREAVIQKISGAAEEYVPNYDVEKIYVDTKGKAKYSVNKAKVQGTIIKIT